MGGSLVTGPLCFALLDDFLFLGTAGSRVFLALLCTMERISESFGAPLAPEKNKGPRTVIKFLGITIDSDHMEFRLPDDKDQDLRQGVHRVRAAKKIWLQELQSLLGKLNFA